ncbi:MAG: outer membrane beta-barrel protein [Candidatus Aminicenantes bacterium]|nr:outer membrane beta-barrel protein [Candidatus Aminicenantes bacterium]NIM83527.1 outer membrane beta-barrel protein [Candidatus Aminicenantes bacterium]NIN22916.1 outer membrane beta-barrel protein [Candidatus Aminicenantes bacterium]NIN46655.1 outer membrane beta-barrel protein [Candidatus Aminicenantes bacterium]NIN89561.1 outer membrane beta-barrel protein [Candidatus Aminicenantes bacterium]
MKVKNRIVITIQLLALTAAVFTGCASGIKRTRMTRFYFEYSRGKSFPTHSDVSMKYENHDFTFHDLYLEDESFFPDDSIIPNAFIKPLLELKLNDAKKAFTEPYYNYRFIYFLKKNPHIGIGYEFTHLKVFLLDKNQRVRMSGIYNGAPIDQTVTVGDYLDTFSVSHGVNHVGLHLVYRWMLKKTPVIKDGRLQPYVGLSFGPTISHLELNTKENGVPRKRAYSFQFSLRNWGLGLGTGVRYKPWRHFGFYLEYKLTYSSLHSLHFDELDNTNVSLDFFTHHLQWGMSLMF